VALVCFSTVGFFTAILEPLSYRQLPKPIELMLGIMAIIGISLIFHFDPVYKKGILLGLASALLGAWFTIQNRRFMQRMKAPTLLTWQLTGGGLLMLLLIPLWLQRFSLQLVWPSTADWIWLLLLTCLCTVWAFHLSLEALKRISAFTVNLSYNLEPVYGILLAFFFFREYEQFQASFYWGGMWIVLALALQTWRIYRSRKPDTSTR
jgi:drug/metabolite transporter (DMT)-like permease